MPDPYDVIRAARSGEHTSEVRKSRFVCALDRVADAAAAQAFIRSVRKRHWDASHHPYAYVLGERGQAQKSSDDGEPGGTAGVPMLEVLRRRGLTDTVAVVTRYFGGVQLGAGGLIRAYGSAVSKALDVIGTVQRIPVRLVTVTTDYRRSGRLESELWARAHRVRESRFTDTAVSLVIAVDEERVNSFRAWIADVTAGESTLSVGPRTFVEVDEENGD